jgi:hypothetical protein
MTQGTFEEGYRAGWEGVAGAAPLPSEPTQPPEGTPRDYQHGFEYGRADALERFEPGQTATPATRPPQRRRANLKLVPKDLEAPSSDSKFGDMGRGSREETHGGG